MNLRSERSDETPRRRLPSAIRRCFRNGEALQSLTQGNAHQDKPRLFKAGYCSPLSNSDEFDYAALDSEVRIVVRQRTAEIKSLMRRTVQDIIEIGQKLTEVKTQLGHGNFLKWLKYEFEWQERSARNFMRVAEAFKMANFADLDFAASALYLLAAPSVPEQVRQTALELADRGETITYSKARDLVNESKQDRRRESGEDLNLALREDEVVEITTDVSVVILSQTEQTPTVEVFPQTVRELQVAIAYEDVRVSITGSKNSLNTFLEQIQSNPSLTEKIVQQIKSQIDKSEITPPCGLEGRTCAEPLCLLQTRGSRRKPPADFALRRRIAERD